MMGVPVDYDDGVEKRKTHRMLLPKVKTERLTISDQELLKEIAVLAPTKAVKKSLLKAKKGILRGKDSKSVLSRPKR